MSERAETAEGNENCMSERAERARHGLDLVDETALEVVPAFLHRRVLYSSNTIRIETIVFLKTIN